MEDLTKYTPTELLNMVNSVEVKHNLIKQEIIDHSIEVDELEEKMNNKLLILDELEKNYIALIEEMNNR